MAVPVHPALGQAVEDERERQRLEATVTYRATRFVIVVPGELGADLESSLASLSEQTWPYWQALVIGADRAGHDDGDNVRFVSHSDESCWTVANQLLNDDRHEDILVVLEPGVRLEPDALYAIHLAVTRDPLVDLVTWEDRVDDPADPADAVRARPSWSPDTLLSGNYVGWAFGVRLRRFLAVGGFRPAFGRAAGWDLLLRCELDAERVTRVPRALAAVLRHDDTADADGCQAVQDALDRRGATADARLVDGAVRLDWRLDAPPTVAVVIPTRHSRSLIGRVLEGLRATEYEALEIRVVDSGERTAENERWYAETFGDLPLVVSWWDAPFNYSAANNQAAEDTTADVLVFLNDDIEIEDATWLRQLVGWATQPGIGLASLQLLDADGAIQHQGAVLGLGGYADHVFQGMRPGDRTLLGPTTWTRNVLAVTGACLAVRRDLFEKLGRFDEGFVLCGSDVALGLAAVIAGHRNVCSIDATLRHLESTTRGTHVPECDFFASWWRYQPWLFGGDPYFSPTLSLGSREPRLREPAESTAVQRASVHLGRQIGVFRQRSEAAEASSLADLCRLPTARPRAVRAQHARVLGRREVRTVNWFIPDLDSPFYGGINTALRIADHLSRNHGVENRFLAWSGGPEQFVSSALAAAFPSLADAPVVLHDGSPSAIAGLPTCDVAIATLWATAYMAARFEATERRFYLIQDFEPAFYPAGTLYALAEESYRLGLYGLCNTERLARIYRDNYGGVARSFMPAVDRRVFHAEGRPERTPGSPTTVFVYARPGHWRNCWELASLALVELKERLGDAVRILAAGSWAIPDDHVSRSVVEHLGLLDYRATGELYRRCDVGLALTVSQHPSYLPLELMACGTSVVAFDNPAGHWLLRDGENSLLAPRTVDGVADALETLCVNPSLRARLAQRALCDIETRHGDWDEALSGVYDVLSDPEAGQRTG